MIQKKDEPVHETQYPAARGVLTALTLTRLSTFASKTPAFAGVLLVGLHYTVVVAASAALPEIFGGAGRATSVRVDPAESPDPASVRHSAAG